MIVTRNGTGTPRIGIVTCMHGNEPLGKQALDLVHLPTDMNIVSIVAHPEAVRLRKRYVETDLNRSFPGSVDGSMEERLALQLHHALADRDFVIDIHTTTAITEPFVIAVSESTLDLVDATPLPFAVFMPPHFAKGKSLLDHVRGISLEFNEHTPASEVAAVVETLLQNVRTGSIAGPKVHFKGVDVLLGNAILPNFTLIKQGTRIGDKVAPRDFYSVLSGEQAYPGVMCIMAVKRTAILD
jgi:hypothetical protein